MGEKLNFHIDHIDPLGQGVHKSETGVCFIPKTLPGETGIAQIIKRSKGVSFAKLIGIDSAHSQRITPECPHFNDCPACQFLHAPYELEIQSKKAALERMLRPLNIKRIYTHAAPRRWSYRNRMQLHYDKGLNKIGMRVPGGILEVPHCLMPNAQLKQSYIELQSSWQQLVTNQPRQGHIEIYAREDGVQTSINQAYADGGFSQVFAEMNAKALKLVQDFSANLNVNRVLDLFGGAGNLSQHLQHSEVYVVDGVIPTQEMASHQKFSQIDLYSKSALHSLSKVVSEKVDLMLVDPPRSGFSGLANFVEHYQPNYLIYMSCFPPTMVRDLKQIGVTGPTIHMLDFFPSTHHMESLALIQLKPSV